MELSARRNEVRIESECQQAIESNKAELHILADMAIKQQTTAIEQRAEACAQQAIDTRTQEVRSEAAAEIRQMADEAHAHIHTEQQVAHQAQFAAANQSQLAQQRAAEVQQLKAQVEHLTRPNRCSNDSA